jgi:hypothetical protein
MMAGSNFGIALHFPVNRSFKNKVRPDMGLVTNTVLRYVFSGLIANPPRDNPIPPYLTGRILERRFSLGFTSHCLLIRVFTLKSVATKCAVDDYLWHGILLY